MRGPKRIGTEMKDVNNVVKNKTMKIKPTRQKYKNNLRRIQKKITYQAHEDNRHILETIKSRVLDLWLHKSYTKLNLQPS